MNWYDQAIIYQIYPKSFQDTNDDGIGDIQGIIKHLGYIKDMGFNTIWLNPIFVSPQIDNGYDVSNYFAIDPILGDTSDFSEMMTKAHELGLHIILDLPINIVFFEITIFGIQLLTDMSPTIGDHSLVVAFGRRIQPIQTSIIFIFSIKKCLI